MARPVKEIDPKQLESLAAIHCSNEEMASVLGVHKRTLERRYAAVIAQGRNKGKMSLKRKRYDVAMQGNVPMLIWLSKQFLGETDKVSSDITEKSHVILEAQLDARCEELEALANERLHWGEK